MTATRTIYTVADALRLLDDLDRLEAKFARLSAPITAADLMAHGMGYCEGDKQAYAEAFNAIISERAKEQHD